MGYHSKFTTETLLEKCLPKLDEEKRVDFETVFIFAGNALIWACRCTAWPDVRLDGVNVGLLFTGLLMKAKTYNPKADTEP